MIKRTTHLLVSLSLLFGLLACSTSGSSTTTPSSPDSDAPVLLTLGIAEAAGSSGAPAMKARAPYVLGEKNIRTSMTATAGTVDYYAGLGESLSLYIEISNPSGYSISRFKINGTAFTSGSFTTDPILPGQTTTVIRTTSISLGNVVQNTTFTISDIKYIAEIGQTNGSEKDVVINMASIASTTVAIGFSGSGTVDDPYLINNEGQLRAVARCTNGNIASIDGYNGKYLKLTADLDLAGENWTPIGTYNNDYIYNYTFKGTFDGGGKSISNLTINNSLLKNIGLFGYVYGGTIKNIVLINCQITNTIFNGKAGGIAGSLENGLIGNCSNAGSITVAGSSSYVAGIVAYVSNSTVSGCSNSGSISSGSSSVDIVEAGGIAGIVYGNSSIQNSYNTGSVSVQGSTYNEVGGIAGRVLNGGNGVANCYNIGSISVSNTGYSYCSTGAGIVGVNEGPITNSVWLDSSAGSIACVGTGTVAAGKPSANMMLQATYTDIGWDFNTVWKINTGEYPKLMWEN